MPKIHNIYSIAYLKQYEYRTNLHKKLVFTIRTYEFIAYKKNFDITNFHKNKKICYLLMYVVVEVTAVIFNKKLNVD